MSIMRKETDAEIYLKHYIKLALGRPDPRWPLFQFVRSIHPQTLRQRKAILAWAEAAANESQTYEREELYERSNDPIVRQGWLLKKKTEQHFKDKYKDAFKNTRFLIHIPDGMKSPGGFSLFSNFLAAFKFLGIEAYELGWYDSTQEVFESVRPTVFLTSDHEIFLSRIDWDAVANYRKQHTLSLGFNAGLEEYGNSPLLQRLEWAKRHDVNFYYSFRDQDYLAARKEYQPLYRTGHSILPLTFGANILTYYPVPNIARDLTYVFLASQNSGKAPRYEQYLKPITKQYPGLIDGPGWGFIDDFTFNNDRNRYLYARAKIGLNMHLEENIQYPLEVNERVFALTACGVPQVVDGALLLKKLFSEKALFIGHTPEEYLAHFETILKHPDIGQAYALTAQKETFERHTTFHRVEEFLQALRPFL